MTVTPNGSPAWVRTAAIEDFGGSVDKTNWHGVGVTNPRTDVGAEAIMRLAADLAAAVRTAPFAVIRLLCNDGSPAAPTIEYVQMMTGIRLVSYAGDAAPAGFPSAVRNGNGDVTLTFEATPTDDYGVEGTVEILSALPELVSASAGEVSYQIPSTTTLRLRAFNSAGSALSDARISVEVYTGAS